MITLNEEELKDLHKNKAIINIDKNTKIPQAKANNNFMPVLNIFFNRILSMLSEIKQTINSLTEVKSKPIETKSESLKPKQPREWNFKVIRNIDGKITNVRAIPK